MPAKSPCYIVKFPKWHEKVGWGSWTITWYICNMHIAYMHVYMYDCIDMRKWLNELFFIVYFCDVLKHLRCSFCSHPSLPWFLEDPWRSRESRFHSCKVIQSFREENPPLLSPATQHNWRWRGFSLQASAVWPYTSHPHQNWSLKTTGTGHLVICTTPPTQHRAAPPTQCCHWWRRANRVTALPMATCHCRENQNNVKFLVGTMQTGFLPWGAFVSWDFARIAYSRLILHWE